MYINRAEGAGGGGCDPRVPSGAPNLGLVSRIYRIGIISNKYINIIISMISNNISNKYNIQRRSYECNN